MERIKNLLRARVTAVFCFMIVLFAGIGIINPVFLRPQNIMLSLQGSVMFVLLAVGVTFVILTRDIDVSVGAILGLSAAVAATQVRDGAPMAVVIAAPLAVGGITGLINGIGVTFFRIPAIVMTLGTMGILRGTLYIYTGGRWVENLPDFFKTASQASVLGGLNVFVLLTLLLVVAMQLYLSFARRGKYFAAIGDNIDGAILVGVPVSRIRVTAFIISGLCSGAAGLVYASQVGFVGNVAGNGTEMTAIAACVLGGVSLGGGVGSVAGAALGAVIINSINTALVFLKIPAFWNNTISGSILLTMVVADALLNRYLANRARRQRLNAKFAGAGAGGEHHA